MPEPLTLNVAATDGEDEVLVRAMARYLVAAWLERRNAAASAQAKASNEDVAA